MTFLTHCVIIFLLLFCIERIRANNSVSIAAVEVMKNKQNKSECGQRPGDTVEEVLSQRLGKKNVIYIYILQITNPLDDVLFLI